MEEAALIAEDLCREPRLRIALVTETYPPEVNGVAMTLGRMVDGLLERGHRVQLIRPRQRSESSEDSVSNIGPGSGSRIGIRCFDRNSRAPRIRSTARSGVSHICGTTERCRFHVRRESGYFCRFSVSLLSAIVICEARGALDASTGARVVLLSHRAWLQHSRNS